ncbi:MAG: PAS domain-containing protein [Bacteroidales bacterium]|nr:PAS domain-containing protein [Bacteroidales bacterium]
MLTTILLSLQNPPDSARDVQFIPSDGAASQITQEIAREDDILMTVYFIALVIALLACAAIYYFYNKRIREYGNVINAQNIDVAKQKLRAESYGTILNSVLFPCCLVSEKGKVGWCNDAFIQLYGEDLKEFDFLTGISGNADVSQIREAVYSVNYSVKMKNAEGKTVGFLRTLIPLPKEADGSKNYAIVENYLPK